MRILLVGKIDSQVTTAASIAKKNGATVSNAPDIDSALNMLCSGKGADLVMVDVQFDVAKMVVLLQQERVHVPVVGYGINSDSKAAVAAIKAGAKEYVPFPPDEKLIAAILEAISRDTTDFIAFSPAMKQVVSLADRIAPTDASVLITGESGTGKEVLAKYLHKKSNRSKENFVTVNCAAIPENLLESELFGHEKGAFTGALQRRIGKFEESNNGTLLLDEISEMDIRLQAKLLRAIQEKEIDRVGGSKPVKLNLRILATSNRDLREEVAKGAFREDLYYRLNVININLPSLSARKEDIMPLAEYFVRKYSEANNLPILTISEDVTAKLLSYGWPGNVRELENAMHRAVLLSTGDKINGSAIMFSESSGDFFGSPADTKMESVISNTSENGGSSPLVGRTVESVERELIINTLKHCLGNRTNAANILGISIRTLRNKLKEYGEAAE